MRQWLPTGLNAIALILFASSALMDGKTRAVIIGCGAASLLLGTYMSARREPQLARLRATLPRLQKRVDLGEETVANLCRKELALISEGLHYFSSERITLFAPHENGFSLVARYSKYQPYCKPGRGIYPLDQGCLGRAWKDGKASEIGLPDPRSDHEAWLTAQRDLCGIPDDVSCNFAMKSRTYVAFRIDGLPGDSLGVVVFESELPTQGQDVKSAVIDPGKLATRIRRELSRLQSLLDATVKLRE